MAQPTPDERINDAARVLVMQGMAQAMSGPGGGALPVEQPAAGMAPAPAMQPGVSGGGPLPVEPPQVEGAPAPMPLGGPPPVAPPPVAPPRDTDSRSFDLFGQGVAAPDPEQNFDTPVLPAGSAPGAPEQFMPNMGYVGGQVGDMPDMEDAPGATTTPSMLDGLQKEGAQFTQALADIGSRMAFAQNLLSTPQERSTPGNPTAAIFSAAHRMMGAMAMKKIGQEHAQVSHQRRMALAEAMQGATTRSGALMRAAAMNASPEEIEPFLQQFAADDAARIARYEQSMKLFGDTVKNHLDFAQDMSKDYRDEGETRRTSIIARRDALEAARTAADAHDDSGPPGCRLTVRRRNDENEFHLLC